VGAQVSRLPRGFQLWVGAATISQIGDAVAYFALGWFAAAYGGGAAGLVLAALIVPRTLFMLLGGAVADRFGSRPTMIVADSAMVVCALAAIALVLAFGPALPLLVAVAFAVGVVTAFSGPAGGAYPARVVEAPLVPRALALRNAGFQLASLAGNPLGGVAVAWGGLVGAFGIDAASFAAAILVVVLLPVLPQPTGGVAKGRAPRRSLVAEIVEGVRTAARVPALRTVLGLYALAGGLVLPVESLLLPLLARERGWTATQTGLAAGAIGAGALLGAVLIARTGPHPRAAWVSGAGLVGTGAGALGFALAPGPAVAVAAGVVDGVGLAMFIAHSGPVLVRCSPPDQLSRMQSLLGVVQSATLVVTNVAVGALAGAAGPVMALVVVAAALGAAGLFATTRHALDDERRRTGIEPA
jgi:MFS family permease